MRAPRLLVGAMLLTLPACGVPLQAAPQPLPMTGEVAAEPTPPGAPESARKVVVYLLDEGGLLQAVPAEGPTGAYESSALSALVKTSTAAPGTYRFTSRVPRGTTLRRVVVSPQDVVVEMSKEFKSLTGDDQIRAVAQVVFTATERRPEATVHLMVDGEALQAPGADGALRQRDLGRNDFQALVPPSSTEPTPVPTP